MIVLFTITQALLYLCFALFLWGAFSYILYQTLTDQDINVPKGALMFAAGGIAIFSFLPVLQLIFHLSPDIGLTQTWQSVLLTFEVGKAWIFTYILSTMIFIFIIWFDYLKRALYAYLGIAFTFILILALGWASHASSYDRVWGFISHTAHLTVVSVWIGILIVVSWFSKDHSNWLNFFKWFTPVAIICFVITIITGLFS